MLTPQFEGSLGELIRLSREQVAALMCAEAVPWRCQRSLIADALLIRGIQVEHIIDGKRTQPHKLTPFACVDALRLTYPAQILPRNSAQARRW